MIHLNSTSAMTPSDTRRFRDGIERRMRGDLTPLERKQLMWRKKVYDEIIRTHGGKNPLLSR